MNRLAIPPIGGGVGLDPASFQLGPRASQLASHGGFDRLIRPPMVRDMEIREHQARSATAGLRRFRGRAKLYDEAGPGETIEAGIIASELVTRGLVRSLLIITPPSLVEPWRGEMRRKFSLDFATRGAFRAAGAEARRRGDRIIASLHTGKREPRRSRIQSREWDMIIVDEARHLRNRKTLARRFVNQLKKQYVLLLTGRTRIARRQRWDRPGHGNSTEAPSARWQRRIKTSRSIP